MPEICSENTSNKKKKHDKIIYYKFDYPQLRSDLSSLMMITLYTYYVRRLEAILYLTDFLFNGFFVAGN